MIGSWGRKKIRPIEKPESNITRKKQAFKQVMKEIEPQKSLKNHEIEILSAWISILFNFFNQILNKKPRDRVEHHKSTTINHTQSLELAFLVAEMLRDRK